MLQIKDNSMDTDTSPSDDGLRNNRRKRTLGKEIICPVCGVTIRTTEVDVHFAVELQRLDKSWVGHRVRKVVDHNEASTSSGTHQRSQPPALPAGTSKDSAWGIYQKIKTNRQARLKTKNRKRKSIENICPVCNRLTSEEIHVHVEKCLNRLEKRDRMTKRNGTSDQDDDEETEDDEDSIDIVGESGGEEYEWAGQTRIRASSLLPGGNYSASGIGSNSTTTNNNNQQSHSGNEEELNVDGDDTTIYGPAQFTEKDVIPAGGSQSADNYLRSLIVGDSPSKVAEAVSVTRQSEENQAEIDNESDSSDTSTPRSIQGQILESLKARIKEYEQQSSSAKNKIKCQICLEDYHSPLVSISCWHVHCESCWLRSLGSRKLCPKCNMITSASDLRRIYL